MPYLADTSIWGWADSGRRPDITEKLGQRVEEGAVITCAPVVLEAMHRARTGEDYERRTRTVFDPLDWLPLGDNQAQRALEVQRQLAKPTHGNHLRPAVDYLVAAIAEAGDDTILWSFDNDLAIICAHTGQPHEAETSTGPGT